MFIIILFQERHDSRLELEWHITIHERMVENGCKKTRYVITEFLKNPV